MCGVVRCNPVSPLISARPSSGGEFTRHPPDEPGGLDGGGFGAGVLYAADTLGRVLGQQTGEDVRAAMIAACEELFEDYPWNGDSFATGVLMAAGDLYIAAESWPSSVECVDVLTTIDSLLDRRDTR